MVGADALVYMWFLRQLFVMKSPTYTVAEIQIIFGTVQCFALYAVEIFQNITLYALFAYSILARYLYLTAGQWACTVHIFCIS